MAFNLLDEVVNARPSTTILLAVAAVLAWAAYLQSPHWKLRHIPTVGGPSWPLLSYLGSMRFYSHAGEMFQEGYERFHGKLFKMAMLDRWLVIVTGKQMIQELIAMPDDHMSFKQALLRLIEAPYTFGNDVVGDMYQIDLIKRDLLRNLPILFPDVYEEIVQAYSDYIPDSDDWVSLPALHTTMRVVARASNMIFVGSAVCRNEEYLTRCISFAKSLMAARAIINTFPNFLKPLIGKHFSPLPGAVEHATTLLGPEIERRRALILEYGKDYPRKPNDMLAWMMDYAQNAADPELFTTANLSKRILLLNFAAIHTSSATFTHALYSLLARPEFIEPIREEIKAVVASEGFTKAALLKMHKLDSFFRESTRLNTVSGLTTMRWSMREHTFSDGTYVPAGTFLAVPSAPLHHDAELYDNACEMDPFRFEKPKEDNLTRRQFTSTDFEYLAFGHGRHACPGRFFANNELKQMMVHLLLHYDLRLEKDGVRPPDLPIGHSVLPNREAKILLRKRKREM